MLHLTFQALPREVEAQLTEEVENTGTLPHTEALANSDTLLPLPEQVGKRTDAILPPTEEVATKGTPLLTITPAIGHDPLMIDKTLAALSQQRRAPHRAFLSPSLPNHLLILFGVMVSIW